MLGLVGYGSSSDEEVNESKPKPVAAVSQLKLESAPDVDTVNLSLVAFANPNQEIQKYNLPVEQMDAAVVGPIPSGETRESHFDLPLNNPAGRVDELHMDVFCFDRQYHQLANRRAALDPQTFLEGGEKRVIGGRKMMDNDVFLAKQSEEKKKKSRKRKRRGNPSDVDGWCGPWAPPKKTKADEAVDAKMKEILATNKEKWDIDHPEEEELAELDDPSGMDAQKVKDIRKNAEQRKQEKSIFHLEDEQDYLGRTYMYCPPEFQPKPTNAQKRCYIPKTLIHTWGGHTSGVNAIQFIPKTGHVLLSCSMDTTIKLWDVHGHRKCLRTCTGHERGIRNIYFNGDGTRFISTGYDKWIKVWDTETGQVVSRHNSGKQCFDAKFYPKDENDILCGQTNKLAVQWDIRANRIVQRYDDHMGAVNSVTFIDDCRRFVTTSDDKKILIWDYGTPVVTKHISEPHLHSVPHMSVHPSGKWMVGQSMDNQLVVYGAKGRLGGNSRKRFKGHISAGYACQVNFSPCGKFVMSGDANGRVFFWDWLTCRIFSKIPAHGKVTMGCIWHPTEASKVATCSWDGTIKYWD